VEDRIFANHRGPCHLSHCKEVRSREKVGVWGRIEGARRERSGASKGTEFPGVRGGLWEKKRPPGCRIGF